MKKKSLRPADLAKAAGMSTQSVRNYEKWGFIPEAERGPQGYRHYHAEHLRALRVAQSLREAYGWDNARRMMKAIHEGDLPAALAVIDAHHAYLHEQRRQVAETLALLRAASTTLLEMPDTMPPQEGCVSAGLAARRVGVRVSAVRFWEQQGLLAPLRDQTNGYRLFDAAQMRRLQIVAMLRKADYAFDAIHVVLDQLAAGSAEQALAAAEKRLKELAIRSEHCVAAMALLWTYVRERGVV